MNNHKKKNPNVKLTENVKKKPRRRIIRATWFEKDKYERLLELFQKHYPKDFPKQETADSIPTIEVRKKISKEKKIKLTNIELCRFWYQYIKKQKHKSLPNKEYEKFLNLMKNKYPKDFSNSYTVSPKTSIFRKITKEKKINITTLYLHRFVNQYFKKQKYFLRKQEKHNKEILKTLQKTYPNVFPKDSKKLLKLGIFEDIKNEGKIHVTDNDLKLFLDNYTKSEDYLQCYFTNPVRHDLKGNIVAPTTQKERFFAKKTLEKLKKI